MARYNMDDGSVLDTDNAKQSWNEAQDSDGSNLIGRSTKSQWHTQTLRRSRKGRYYIEQTARIEGQKDHAMWTSNRFAAAWLLLNDHAIPDDLKAAAEEVSE